jgi:hypothetical protein
MAHPFTRYARALRPLLDAALAERIGALLAGLSASRGEQIRNALCGGKKVRGTLLCLTAEALGANLESALPRAVAVELIQTASLIHDDVVDRDALRRGAPATWSVVGERRAVLLGDVLFSSAIEDLTRIGAREGGVIARAIARIAEGALAEPLDPASLAQTVTEGRFPADTCQRIIGLKTGELFGAACTLGALAAGTDEDLGRRVGRFGSLIGEAYQLADDLEDFRRFLEDGSRGPEHLAPIAPALLCFVAETGPAILALLRGELLSGARRRKVLRLARQRLRAEIHGRLGAAAAALGDRLPGRPATVRALRSAPREIIRQFLAGEADGGEP